MNILAIGDFHGRFPGRLKREAKKADLIIALGDYANADKIRKIIFKHWTDKPWYEVVGMKKAQQMEKESFYSGLKVLRELNNLGKPVYLIWGNTDFYKDYATSEPPVIMPGYYENRIKKMKNLILLDKKKRKTKRTEIVGHGGYVDVTGFIKKSFEKDEKKRQRRLKRYKKSEKMLKKLLLKHKPDKNFIFVIHYTPIGAFDKVLFENSPMYGKSAGWKPYNEAIKKHLPKLVLCGHMHEYQGKKKLGKSLVVNPGPASEGKFAVIDWPNLKVKFFR